MTNFNFSIGDKMGFDGFWNPSVIKMGYNGVKEMSLRPYMLERRKILLSGEITQETVSEVLQELNYLTDSSDSIDIYIDSPGGSVDAGLAIYDMIQALDGKMIINTYCVSMSASMGAVLLAGGQKGRRYILPHSRVMIHEPLLANGCGGSATSIMKTAESIAETKDLINGILAKHTGKTVEEINAATAFDNFMNAEEAVEFGICDEIKNIF